MFDLLELLDCITERMSAFGDACAGGIRTKML